MEAIRTKVVRNASGRLVMYNADAEILKDDNFKFWWSGSQSVELPQGIFEEVAYEDEEPCDAKISFDKDDSLYNKEMCVARDEFGDLYLLPLAIEKRLENDDEKSGTIEVWGMPLPNELFPEVKSDCTLKRVVAYMDYE